jgi:CheY-like chemotaxis protein
MSVCLSRFRSLYSKNSGIDVAEFSILPVDDNEVNQKHIGMLLEKQEHALTAFENGQEALYGLT